MRREWVYFDVDVILGEFAELPVKDRAKMLALMEHYRTAGLNNPSPAKVDDYGDGIKRLRHVKSAYQGRLLFFAIDRDAGFERLVVLTTYKKQSQDVPKHILDRAKARWAQFEMKGK